MSSVSAEEIDHFLPQTQCGQCGYEGCMPYAEAIASHQADINQCPPGGQSTIRALATLLQRDEIPLNKKNGTEKPFTIVKIDENVCIGCVKCIRACPVDAIIGAAKQMHTVLQEHCTGCELCIEPCPVDCIDIIVPPTELADRYSDFKESKIEYRQETRERFNKRNERFLKQEQTKKEKQAAKQQIKDKAKNIAEKQAFIKAAIARSKEKRKEIDNN